MRLKPLDALRTLAVALVILSHLDVPPAGTSSVVAGIMNWFRLYGPRGVDLFFVLSGFLVSGLLFREYQSRATVDVPRFLIRRGLKIYPAFYVFLALAIPLRLYLGDHIASSQIWREVLFVQNYGPGAWTHTWSLAVEEHFYLLLAGAVVLLARRKSRDTADPFSPLTIMFFVVATAVLVARGLTWWFVPFSNPTHIFPTHLRVDALLFGVLLSYHYHFRPGLSRTVARYRSPIVLVGLGLLWLSQHLGGAGANYVVGRSLVYLGFGAVVLAAVCARSDRPWGRMASGIALIGTFSYSIYLWHTADFAFGDVALRKLGLEHMNYWLVSFARVVTSFALGIVMARLVELPVLALRDRLFPSRGARSPRVSLSSVQSASVVASEQVADRTVAGEPG